MSIAGQYSKAATPQGDQADLMQKLQRAQASEDQTRLEYAQLKAKYDSISSQPGVSAPLAMEMAVLVQSQKNLQETITQLETRNRELEGLLAKRETFRRRGRTAQAGTACSPGRPGTYAIHIIKI